MLIYVNIYNMTEQIINRHREMFKQLSYFNKLIETISLSNNTIENKIIHIKRVKNLAKSLLSHSNSN
jgi:hypothetical protein